MQISGTGSERSAKCAATGTFHNLQNEMPHAYYRNYIDFFKTNTYHPVRKLLYQHRTEISDWLTCRISPYRETVGNNKFSARLRRSTVMFHVYEPIIRRCNIAKLDRTEPVPEICTGR